MNAGHDVVARQIHFQCDDAPARFLKPEIEIIDPWKYREGNQNNDGGDEATLEAQIVSILPKVLIIDCGL